MQFPFKVHNEPAGRERSGERGRPCVARKAKKQGGAAERLERLTTS